MPPTVTRILTTTVTVIGPTIGLGILLATASIAAQAQFVVAGQARDVHAAGGAWHSANGALVGAGVGKILRGGRLIGAGDFRVRARLTVRQLGKSAASLLINTSHFGLAGRMGEMFTEGPVFGRRNLGVPVVEDGKPFVLTARRAGDLLIIEVDGKEMVTGRLARTETVDVGLRPHRATMRVESFSATGTFLARPKPLPHTAVFRSGTGAYHTYRIPAVVVSTKGTLLAFCEGRKSGAGDAGDIDLLVKRSTDGGATWSESILVWDDGANTCGNPCPVVDRDTGTLWLAMTWNLGTDHERDIMAGKSRQPRHAYITSSRDDGKTWSPPKKISDTVRKPHWRWYATGPGNGIQLSEGAHKGRLLIPANHSDHGDPGTHPYRSHVFWSDDHGQTWQLGGVHQDRTNESAVVELADGSILQAMRSYHDKNRRAMSRSHDGGATWGAVYLDEALDTPVCQASILRYAPPGERAKRGPLQVLFSSPKGSGRAHLTVWSSPDGGRSWPVQREIYAGPAAYSNLVALPDGRIGVLYEKDGYRSIELVTFSAGWLRGK